MHGYRVSMARGKFQGKGFKNDNCQKNVAVPLKPQISSSENVIKRIDWRQIMVSFWGLI